jgi:hypothetical protein
VITENYGNVVNNNVLHEKENNKQQIPALRNPLLVMLNNKREALDPT